MCVLLKFLVIVMVCLLQRVLVLILLVLAFFLICLMGFWISYHPFGWAAKCIAAGIGVCCVERLTSCVLFMFKLTLWTSFVYPGTFGVVDYTNYEDMKYAVSCFLLPGTFSPSPPPPQKKRMGKREGSFVPCVDFCIFSLWSDLTTDMLMLFRFGSLMTLSLEILGQGLLFG